MTVCDYWYSNFKFIALHAQSMTMKKPSTNADNSRRYRHRLAVEDPLLEQTRKRARGQSRQHCKAPTKGWWWQFFFPSTELSAVLHTPQRLAMWK